GRSLAGICHGFGYFLAAVLVRYFLGTTPWVLLVFAVVMKVWVLLTYNSHKNTLNRVLDGEPLLVGVGGRKSFITDIADHLTTAVLFIWLIRNYLKLDTGSIIHPTLGE